MATKKSPPLPDPVTGTSGHVSAHAWVNKDGWTGDKPPEGERPRFFVTATLQRGRGKPPLEVEIHGDRGLDEEDIKHLAASLTLVVGQIGRG